MYIQCVCVCSIYFCILFYHRVCYYLVSCVIVHLCTAVYSCIAWVHSLVCVCCACNCESTVHVWCRDWQNPYSWFEPCPLLSHLGSILEVQIYVFPFTSLNSMLCFVIFVPIATTKWSGRPASSLFPPPPSPPLSLLWPWRSRDQTLHNASLFHSSPHPNNDPKHHLGSWLKWRWEYHLWWAVNEVYFHWNIVANPWSHCAWWKIPDLIVTDGRSLISLCLMEDPWSHCAWWKISDLIVPDGRSLISLCLMEDPWSHYAWWKISDLIMPDGRSLISLCLMEDRWSHCAWWKIHDLIVPDGREDTFWTARIEYDQQWRQHCKQARWWEVWQKGSHSDTTIRAKLFYWKHREPAGGSFFLAQFHC